MNALITSAAAAIIADYQRVLPQVRQLTAQQLNNLEHEARELETSQEFSIRTGAHIVRAAVVMEIEERKDAGRTKKA